MQLHIEKALLATGIFDTVTVQKHDDKGVELVVRVSDPNGQAWLNFFRRFSGKSTWLPVYKFEFSSEDEMAVAKEVVEQIGVRRNKEIVKEGGIPLGLNAFHVGRTPLNVVVIPEGGFGHPSSSKKTKKFLKAIAAAVKDLSRPEATPKKRAAKPRRTRR